ncbi:MAG: prephenate dehydratase [bacterium]|nr:prephenate dehydratase [bacterium]
MIDLIESRDKIDEIDRKILELFEQRMKITQDVAEYKINTGKKVLDKEREQQKLEVLSSLASNPFNAHAVNELFTQIMSMSRKWQYGYIASNANIGYESYKKLSFDSKTKVAFFGEAGSYTEQAMIDFFGEEIEGISVCNFKQVMDMVKYEEVEFGVLPIENSSTGGITDIFDLLFEYGNTIIGEHYVKIDHALMAVKGATEEDLKEVYSHPQGLLQCREYFEDKEWISLKPCTESTSAAAKYVSEKQDKSIGAIASTRAAKCYDLDVLQYGINKEEKNSTRFIIITNKRIYNENANKVSICFEIPHESGSLYTMLSHIIYNGLNMTKIESRPISGRTWEYRFFVEFEGNLKDPGVRNALIGINEEASSMKVLGNFKTV